MSSAVSLLRVVLIFGCLFFGLTFELFGFNVNVERMLAPVAVLLVFILFSSGIYRSYAVGPVVLYMGWWTVSVVSAFLSGQFTVHIPGLLIEAIPLVYFLVFSWPQNIAATASAVAPVSLIVCVVILSAGFFGLIDNHALFETNRLRLFFYEPNILGSTTAAFTILSYSRAKTSHVARIGVLCGLILVIMSLSKAPYAAFLFCSFLYIFLVGRNRYARLWLVLMATIPLGALVFVVFSENVMFFFSDFLYRQDAINSRAIVFSYAWDRFLDNPVFGNGPLDLAISSPFLSMEYGSDSIRAVWIGQMFLSLLHDTGIVGMVFYLAFLVSSLKECWRSARDRTNPYAASFFCAAICLIICSQATTTHLSSIFGVLLGLAASVRPLGEMRYTNRIGGNRPISVSDPLTS